MSLLTDSDKAWLHAYREAAEIYFNARLSRHVGKFGRRDYLLRRFTDACQSISERGWSQWYAIETALNELSVAIAILESSDIGIASLYYEPQTEEDKRTIDFVVVDSDERNWFVDVKTIVPQRRDRWAQFERASNEQWLTRGTEIIISPQEQGGEIWHGLVAARSRMLEYTLEFEKKLQAGYPDFDAARAILMFCGNGFDWREDWLEDFVSFYTSGVHRPDDPFGNMEQHHIQTEKLVLPRRVKRFGYLQRVGCALVPTRVTWNVQAPRFPASLVG
jgi:hypothetical protein